MIPFPNQHMLNALKVTPPEKSAFLNAYRGIKHDVVAMKVSEKDVALIECYDPREPNNGTAERTA